MSASEERKEAKTKREGGSIELKSGTKLCAAIVVLSLLFVGGTYAALLSYFGLITTTTHVEQAVQLDGVNWDQPITEELTVAGGESFCRPHWLQSQTSVPVTVQFVTTYVPALTDDEITVTYKTEITDDNPDFGSRDNEAVAFPITSGLTLNDLFAGDGLSYTYTIIDGGAYDGASPVMAVIDLDDGRHVMLYAGWGARTGQNTLTFSETTAYDTGGNHLVDFVVYDDAHVKIWGSPGSYPPFAGIKTSPSVPITGTEVVTRIAIQHQAANTGETDSLDSLTFSGTTYNFAITEGVPFTLQPGQKLHFVVCYEFIVNIAPETYVIYSEVKPA